MRLSRIDKINDLYNRGLKTAARYLLKRVECEVRRKVFRQRFTVVDVNDCKMYVDLNDSGISRTLMTFGTREKEHIYILKKYLRPGDVVLDIGANIGYYVLIEAQIIGNQGRIYAIEPSPSNIEILKKNISLNGIEKIVEVNQIGISNKTSVKRFYVSHMSNLGTFFPARYYGDGIVDERSPTIDVNTVSISDFVSDKKEIAMIRMDIEGYEVEAFEGMIPLLKERNFAPRILFETHRPKYDDKKHSMRDALKAMFKYGYYPLIIVSNNHPKGEFLKRGYKPETLIHTDGYVRGIYYGVTNKDAIDFICDIGFVRAVLLERRQIDKSDI
jgi:FkbM family methyltransferase